MPKTNAQRQQQFRQNRKKIQQNETLDSTLARKKIDAERSKRYRDRLKSRKQRAKLESAKIDSQFQMQTNQIQPSMNNEVQQVISPNFQSFQAPYEEHDEYSMPNVLLRHETNIDGDVHTSETQEHRSIPQQSVLKSDKVPVTNSCNPIELPRETCSRTNTKNAIDLSCQDFPIADPLKIKECNEVSSKNKKSKKTKWCEVQLKFVDHVVMIWLRRRLAFHGNRVMLDMLMAKANETANLLGGCVSIPCTWLSSFKKKLNDAPNDGLSRRLTGKGPLTIEEIVVDEWPRFCKDEANSSEESDTDDEETMPDAVHTFEEALDCLGLVEGYTLLAQNVRALELISQIKEILKTEVI